MANMAGKIIEARTDSSGSEQLHIGIRLRRLRELAGLTQIELARRLGIGKTTLSKIENGSNIQVSTLRDYVEGLGARLTIDASLGSTIDGSLQRISLFDASEIDDNQLELPILSEEKYKARRDVVLSIRPHYSSLILEGKKTVELRRRFPTEVPADSLAFIYSTAPERAMVGTAKIKNVLKRSVEAIWLEHAEMACIKKRDFDAYFSGLTEGFVLKIADARPFPKPFRLEELRARFMFEPPQSFLYAKRVLREALTVEQSEISH